MLSRGHVVQGALRVAIAGALLLYLLTANVKAVFARRNTPNNSWANLPELECQKSQRN
jgi:hypothetical protein